VSPSGTWKSVVPSPVHREGQQQQYVLGFYLLCDRVPASKGETPQHRELALRYQVDLSLESRATFSVSCNGTAPKSPPTLPLGARSPRIRVQFLKSIALVMPTSFEKAKG